MSEEIKNLKIEDSINNSNLSGDALKDTLDFVDYMRENEMPPGNPPIIIGLNI